MQHSLCACLCRFGIYLCAHAKPVHALHLVADTHLSLHSLLPLEQQHPLLGPITLSPRAHTRRAFGSPRSTRCSRVQAVELWWVSTGSSGSCTHVPAHTPHEATARARTHPARAWDPRHLEGRALGRHSARTRRSTRRGRVSALPARSPTPPPSHHTRTQVASCARASERGGERARRATTLRILLSARFAALVCRVHLRVTSLTRRRTVIRARRGKGARQGARHAA